MKFDKHAIIEVCERLRKLTAYPPLFAERVTPPVVRNRQRRVSAWLGPIGRAIVADTLRSSYPQPKIPTRKYGKGWKQ